MHKNTCKETAPESMNKCGSASSFALYSLPLKEFLLQKEKQLSKKDKSKKGSYDKEIVPVLDLINSFSCYYTTSSCAGRICLFVQPESGKKCDAEWLFVSHQPVKPDEILAAVSDKALGRPEESRVKKLWLRQEPFIVHVCARTLEDAEILLSVAHNSGLKHSGIISLKKRIIIEITGNQHLETPIICSGRCIMPDSAIAEAAEECNKKLLSTRASIAVFERNLKEKYNL